jgi:hypothetical protein
MTTLNQLILRRETVAVYCENRTEHADTGKAREERSGKVVRDTTFRVRKKESIFPVLKVPRQCPLVLLVEAAHLIGIRFCLFI